MKSCSSLHSDSLINILPINYLAAPQGFEPRYADPESDQPL
jgi:hypothetical protein